MFVRKFFFRLLVILLYALLSLRTAHADIVVATSSSAPSDHLLTSYSIASSSFVGAFQWIGDSSGQHWDAAQSFLVSGTNDWSVDKITVWVREFGTSVASQPYTLQMWTVSDAAAVAGGTLVSSQSATFPNSGLAAGYWTFDIADVTLTTGQHYAFVLGFDSGPDAERYVDIVKDYSASDSFSDGRMFYRKGTPPIWTAPSALSDKDIVFYVQGTPAPEPSTIVLLATAAACLLFMAWQRRKQSY